MNKTDAANGLTGTVMERIRLKIGLKLKIYTVGAGGVERIVLQTKPLTLECKWIPQIWIFYFIFF